jgi:CHAT domain-containing protein
LREEKKLSEETERAKGEVTALEGKLDRLVERLRLLDRAYTAVSYPLPASLAEVQSALPAGTALLEYAGANEDYGVFVITRGAVRAIWLGSATLVGTEVERVRELLGPQGRGLSPLDAVGRLRSLAKLVLDPALEALPASEDVRRLLIAPDWSLCLLPFEVLLVSEPKEPAQAREWPYLLRRYSVAYVHSGTALREAVLARSEQGPRHGARRFVAFAHPDYLREDGAQDVLALAAVVDPSRSGFAPLPGTAREALEAARLFAEGDELERIDAALESLRRDGSRLEAAEIAGKRFTLFLGSGAGEEALKARPEVKAASILHLACHGRADLDAPALSHLALAQRWGSEPKAAEDGLVTLRELRDLDLQAELVVLSACETNAGKLLVNEGVAGLSRAALAAGARAVVSTLWRVDDEPARRLVVSFYRRLLNERLSRAEALRRAKLEAIEAGLPLSTWSAYLLWDAGE